MVRLTKIYTKTGDDGTTGLATGQRVRKDDLRVEAYGTADEANAILGVCVVLAEQGQGHKAAKIAAVLRLSQHDLFDLGADLATPIQPSEQTGVALRIIASQTQRLENTIDSFNAHLAPLTSFVLPGGSPLAAHLHMARTVVRRAERIAVTLHAEQTTTINLEAIKYLNRLSDLLFVLSRVANRDGENDVLWIPGKSRGS
jgi:cob(I)alamin adenosyltransferase